MTSDLAKEDNNVTALVMYNFMANQIALHTQDYKDAGISEDAMRQQIKLIEESVVYDKENQYEKELYQKLEGNLLQAQKMIAIVFGNHNSIISITACDFFCVQYSKNNQYKNGMGG